MFLFDFSLFCNLGLAERHNIYQKRYTFLLETYLGSIITEDARCVNEVKRRIAVAKSTFSKLDNILRNRSLSMKVRFRVLDCYVYPVLMYGSEAWSITSDRKDRGEEE